MNQGERGRGSPERIGRYLLIEKLGEGGMGVVYRAQDELFERPVAIKLLRPDWAQDPGAAERFQREARITSTLTHPHICAVYEFGEFESCPYMVEELMEGQTLSELLGGWPLAAGRVLDIGIQVADALAAAHDGGVIHRDIKSSNIFITDNGVAKVLDFGLAKLTGEISAPSPPPAESSPQPSSSLSNPGLALGTATNMSPEQVAGKELDPRSDIFSLGVVLYEMATGVLPFRGLDAAMIMKAILYEAYPPPLKLNPNVPAALEGILEKALHKDRDRRYQSMGALKADLTRVRQELQQGDGEQAAATPSSPAIEKPAPVAAKPVPQPAPVPVPAPVEEELSREAPTVSAQTAVVEPWDAVAREARDFVERGAGVLYWFRVPLGGIAYPVGFRSSLQPALDNPHISEIRLVLDSVGGMTPQIFSKQVMPLIQAWAKRSKRVLTAEQEVSRGRYCDQATRRTLLSWVYTDLSVELVPSFKLFVRDGTASSGEAERETAEVEILLSTTVQNVRTGDGSQHTLRVPDAVLRARTATEQGLCATLTRIARRWDPLFW